MKLRDRYTCGFSFQSFQFQERKVYLVYHFYYFHCIILTLFLTRKLNWLHMNVCLCCLPMNFAQFLNNIFFTEHLRANRSSFNRFTKFNFNGLKHQVDEWMWTQRLYMITITLLITVIRLIVMMMRLEMWLKLPLENYTAGNFGSNRPEVFHDKGCLKSFAKFTGKHLCQSLFFHKVAGFKSSKFCELKIFLELRSS